MFGYLSLNNLYGVGNGGQYHLKTLPNCLGAAGQVDDEAFASDTGHSSAQDGVWCYLGGFGSHRFGETGGNLIQDGEGGFRCGITMCQSGTACGQDKVYSAGPAWRR